MIEVWLLFYFASAGTFYDLLRKVMLGCSLFCFLKPVYYVCMIYLLWERWFIRISIGDWWLLIMMMIIIVILILIIPIYLFIVYVLFIYVSKIWNKIKLSSIQLMCNLYVFTIWMYGLKINVQSELFI